MPVFTVGAAQVTDKPEVVVEPPIGAGQRRFTLVVTDRSGAEIGRGEVVVTVPPGRIIPTPVPTPLPVRPASAKRAPKKASAAKKAPAKKAAKKRKST